MAKTIPAIRSEFAILREKSGLSCDEASQKLGVSLRTIYRWENGASPAHHLALRELRELVNNSNCNSPEVEEKFTYIDLFAGIGGFRKAFDSIGGDCVFTSEWDKACRITYQANYTCNHTVAGDIREYTKDEERLSQIPHHDLLVAGFPCQPFSLAGVSKKNSLGRAHGFRCDTQGTLFFDLAQIIDYHRPPAILLENVKNLVSHDQGRTFEIIRRTLEDELKYKIDFRIIDGRSWVPQHRERIFIVGFREDVGFDFKKFPIPNASDNPKLGSILHREDGTEEDEAPYTENGKVASKYTLSEHLWKYLQSYRERHEAKGNGFGYSLFGPEDVARTLSARYYKDGSEILIKQNRKRPRRLTPRECSRLMGFDGVGESLFKIPVSDTQAYRQFGNSVIAPLARTVAQFMKPYILQSKLESKAQLKLPFEKSRNFALAANG